MFAKSSGTSILNSEKMMENVCLFLSINKHIQEGTFKMAGTQKGKKV